MTVDDDVVLWAWLVARSGYPSWLLADYLMRECELSPEEAVFVAVSAVMGAIIPAA
jgi:hypothetical protein